MIFARLFGAICQIAPCRQELCLLEDAIHKTIGDACAKSATVLEHIYYHKVPKLHGQPVGYVKYDESAIRFATEGAIVRIVRNSVDDLVMSKLTSSIFKAFTNNGIVYKTHDSFVDNFGVPPCQNCHMAIVSSLSLFGYDIKPLNNVKPAEFTKTSWGAIDIAKMTDDDIPLELNQLYNKLVCPRQCT